MPAKSFKIDSNPQKVGSDSETVAMGVGDLKSRHNRAGEPSVTFCGREEQGSGRKAYFKALGKKISRSKADFAPTWSG